MTTELHHVTLPPSLAATLAVFRLARRAGFSRVRALRIVLRGPTPGEAMTMLLQDAIDRVRAAPKET